MTNKNKPFITFGIPCYNAEKTILNLLKCFKKTEEFRYEIVIVDDKSTDETLKICKGFRLQSSLNIKFVVHRNNQGVSAARNSIIDVASGTWLTFIDSDDLIDFDKYRKIIKNLRNNDNLIICTQRHTLKRHPRLSWLISTEIINAPWAKFYRLELLQKHRILFPTDLDLGEDLIFNLQYALVCKQYRLIHTNPYKYIRRSSGLSTKYREDKFETLTHVNNECFEIIADNNCDTQKLQKSLEYIKTKNLASCIKTYQGKNICAYAKNLKTKNPRRYLFLNSAKETTLYNFWHIAPQGLLITILRKEK